MDVEDECTLVAIGSDGGRGTDDSWGTGGWEVMGAMEGDEESCFRAVWLVVVAVMVVEEEKR